MAEQENSVVDHSEHSEIHSGNSLVRMMKFDESGARDKNSFYDDIVELAKTTADQLRAEKSCCGNDGKLTEPTGGMFREVEMKRLSDDSQTEPQHRNSHTSSQNQNSYTSPDCQRSTTETDWQSTPSGHCSVNVFSCPAVCDGPVHSSVCGSQSATCVSAESAVTIVQCHQEKVINDCSPLHCLSSTAAAAAVDVDCKSGVTELTDACGLVSCDKSASIASCYCGGVAGCDKRMLVTSPNDDGVVSSDKSMPVTSLDCRTPGNNDTPADINYPHNELPASAAVSASEEIACADGDRELASCLSAADVMDRKGSTTEHVCQELSEMMRECVIDDSDVKPVLNSTATDTDVDDGCVKPVLNCTASDADVSDSFDLDVAAKDLERAVSAGMLDYLLESYEDSDEDMSSEQLCEGLDEWSPVSLSDDDDEDDGDDDDNDDGSESTLAETPSDDSDDSIAVTFDSESGNDDDDDDNNVLRRQEGIKRHSKRNYNGDDDDDAGNEDIKSASDGGDHADISDDDTDVKGVNVDAVLKHRERVKNCVKTSDCNDDDDDDDDAGYEDIKSVSDGGDHADISDNDTDVKDVNVDAVLKHRERVKNYMKSSDCNDDDDDDDDGDDDSCAADADISTADVVCAHNFSDNSKDGDDDADDDVRARRESVKQLLKSADAADDGNICKATDANLADADVSGNCSDNACDSSLHRRCSMNAVDADNIATADDVASDVNCADDAVMKNRVSTSKSCVFMPDNDKQSELCGNTCITSMSSPPHECNLCDIQDKLNALTVRTNDAESAVCPGIPPPSPPLPSDVRNTNTRCNFSGDTSLLLGELGAGSTSTPSTCSHHSQTHQSIIEWREGVYNGLCRHSDGSEIRT